MPGKKASGISVTGDMVPVILGMVARDDREHDIAAWFGLNQGRVAEVKQGKHGTPTIAKDLPPKGPPGVKGRALRDAVAQAIDLIEKNGDAGWPRALKILTDAMGKYNANEA